MRARRAPDTGVSSQQHMNTFQIAKTFAMDLLFPKHCFGCKREGTFLCASCLNDISDKVEIQRCPACSHRNFTGAFCRSCQKISPIRRLLFAFNYKDPLPRDLIHALKYHGVKELASPLASLLGAAVRKNALVFPKHTLVVPIPLHTKKMRQRGFNQAELIGTPFAAEHGLALVTDNLIRKTNTASQVTFSDFKEKKTNMQDAFSVLRPQEFAGRRILLIDDVSTSRATLDEAAYALLAAGALLVWGIVIARG